MSVTEVYAPFLLSGGGVPAVWRHEQGMVEMGKVGKKSSTMQTAQLGLREILSAISVPYS